MLAERIVVSLSMPRHDPPPALCTLPNGGSGFLSSPETEEYPSRCLLAGGAGYVAVLSLNTPRSSQSFGEVERSEGEDRLSCSNPHLTGCCMNIMLCSALLGTDETSMHSE